MFCPFATPSVKFGFEIPRVKSINTYFPKFPTNTVPVINTVLSMLDSDGLFSEMNNNSRNTSNLNSIISEEQRKLILSTFHDLEIKLLHSTLVSFVSDSMAIQTSCVKISQTHVSFPTHWNKQIVPSFYILIQRLPLCLDDSSSTSRCIDNVTFKR